MKNSDDDLGLLQERTFYLEERFELQNQAINQALNASKAMLDARTFKAVHLISRIKNQLIKGNIEEKKRFFSWLFKRSSTYTDGDHRFQPLYSVYDPLRDVLDENKRVVANKIDPKFVIPDNFRVNNNFFFYPYTKYDVIIFGIIDYAFRFQRPQQIASRFAKDGHRTFYINANFNKNYINKISENLYEIGFSNKYFKSIYDTDWLDDLRQLKYNLDELITGFKIKDGVVIVDYPNWIRAAVYLRERYGFKIITDNMDDFTGFLNPAKELIAANSEKLLEISDGVISSSEYLGTIAEKYTKGKHTVIRNGTEFLHFNQALNFGETKRQPVIGYYGAISHWFDFEKVEYLAENLPSYKIQLIGEVTDGYDRLSKHPNIELLGEKPYSELPEYLAEFDVCLIPFDTSSNLIKATNPVKFYEYLSAGKKIVATDIPELTPYKDKFVLLANDKETFLNHVRHALATKDSSGLLDQRIEFARSQDWDYRYNEYKEFVRKTVPSVEIIVLTYNGLDVNKRCLNSIITKTAYPNYKITVVDNKSTDGTTQYLTTLQLKHSNVLSIILNEDNLGFAGGNNVGLKQSKSDYILLLNNDTIVTHGWITNLVKHLENDPGLGMVGPVTNAIGNEARIEANYSREFEMDLFAERYTQEHIGKLWKNPNVLAFFCVAIRNDTVKSCGYLDEAFEVGMFEDDDYAERVRANGYKLAIAEDVFIHHFENYSFKKVDDGTKTEIFLKNKDRFEKKWGKTWIPHQYRISLPKDKIDGGCIKP